MSASLQGWPIPGKNFILPIAFLRFGRYKALTLLYSPIHFRLRLYTIKPYITLFVTHDQEEALSMSDTVVVMRDGEIQQIGTPEMIYNEPKNAFVADFIGESNIIDGVMLRDELVYFAGHAFPCVDRGFGVDEPVDVVVRPEDIKMVPESEGMLTGVIRSITFKGVHYEVMVQAEGYTFMIHSTTTEPVGTRIGLQIGPSDIHIMKKETGAS